MLVSRGQPYNVVLTHLSADFDSLAAAVGVAKLWNAEDRKASVKLFSSFGTYWQRTLALVLQCDNGSSSSRRWPPQIDTPSQLFSHVNSKSTRCPPRIDKLSGCQSPEKNNAVVAVRSVTVEQVPTYVVLPRGAHPSVAKFLALHQELFPILGLELLDPTGVSFTAGAGGTGRRVDRNQGSGGLCNAFRRRAI